MSDLKKYLESSASVKQQMSNDAALNEQIQLMIKTAVNCFQSGNKIILCGNGGSTCDAMHIAEELTGRYHLDRPPLPAISLNDPAHITCTANDYGFEKIFERGVEAYGKKGDLLFAFSTSGNSKNVVLAAKKAKDLEMKVIAFTGVYGGVLKNFCDIWINVPSEKTSHIQEAHITIGHYLIEQIENTMFNSEVNT